MERYNKIRIFSSVESVDLESKYAEYTKDDTFQRKIIVYPEFIRRHPKELMRDIRRIVRDCINNNIYLDVLTTSEIVFYCIRIELNRCKIEGELIQFTDDHDISCFMTKDNRIHYVDGIFDNFDTVLNEILNLTS